jgi:hypothetical protein
LTASPRSRRALFVAFALGVPLAVADACSSSSPPTLGGSGTDSGPARADSSSTDDGQTGNDVSAPDGSGGGDTGNGGDASDGSTVGSDASDAAPDHFDAGPPPPVCPTDASVGDAATLVFSTPDPDLMGGISNDNLVVAWTSVPDDGGVYIHWAERATPTAAFGAMQTLDPSLGPFAPDHVALRGDGMQLVAVSADRSTLYEIGRTAYGTPFATVDTNTDFPSVNPVTEGGNTRAQLGPFGSPSLASTFASEWAFIQGNAGFVVSQNALGVWTQPSYPASLTPPASDAFNLVPTGWGIDGRTLFYWDIGYGVERAAWRGAGNSLTFTSSTDLGTIEQYALPSADCTQLYFSAPGAGGDLDLFVSSF